MEMSPTNVASWSKGMTPYSDTQIDDSTSSSCNECMDEHASNEELSIV